MKNSHPAAQPLTSDSTPLPFFYFKDGVLQLCEHHGMSMLPADWEGLISGPNGVKDLWYLGMELGERTFNKLRATTKEAAIAEIQALLAVPAAA
ncbi:hypothetical protein [Pseudomonas saponiphila]|jgi:hypothetical protein|nr:hypothetical protein [Pseudomonas saponiphila]